MCDVNMNLISANDKRAKKNEIVKKNQFRERGEV